ncbi:MAG TPA: serine/threonine-protein kinase, partial [Iamia sp.]|nr:serine/threonine-protein kinase [Iamia sp.]
DIDDDGGALFIVMERLPGPSLDRRIYEAGSLAEDEVMRIAADMLAGLAAAHAEHLVHRDIKPGNLIKSAGGRWKVGDFGVAKDLASTAHLTLVGVAVGTPAYLAPEQLDGRPATPATDLWAAGVVLREALTGRRPFEGNDPIEVAHAVQSTIVPPLLTVRPDVSPGLALAIDRSLSFDPRQRFATAQDMLDAIQGKGPALVPLLPVDAVPAPPPSVSGEVVPIAPVGAGAIGPVGSVGPAGAGGRPEATSGEVPAIAPAAGPPAAGGGSGLRVVVIVAVVAASLLLLFLMGLLFGLVMLGDEGEDVDESPPPTTTQPAADSEAPASDEPPSTSTTTAPTTTSAPGGLLPGDGPITGPPPTTDGTPGGTEPPDQTPSSTTPGDGAQPGQEPKPDDTRPEDAFGTGATLNG